MTRPIGRSITMLMLAAAALPAWATQTFCVNTVGEFNSAYAVADEENVVIQLVRGSYDMTGSCLDRASPCDIDDDVTIRGGYAPGCGSRTLSAVDTVLTRPGGGLMIDTTGNTFSGNGDVVLESLTFRNVPNGLRIDTENGNTYDAYASLRRLWFDQTGGLNVADTSEVAIRQSLFSRTTASCAVKINATEDDHDFLERATLYHVTIADSSGDGLCIGTPDSRNWAVTLMNTIAWDNDGDDIVLRSTGDDPIDASIYNNTYASLVSTPLSMTPSGAITSNPQFVSPATGDFELGGTSASINSGFPQGNVASDRDLKGDPRQFSNAADRGALESPVGSTATTLTVTSAGDSGLGTLRQALLDANQSPNFNRIVFSIGTTCGPRLISLLSNLPSIVHPLRIEGYTQPGALRNSSLSASNAQICVILHQAAGAGAFVGLAVSSGATADSQLQVEGLGFSNFLIAGVALTDGNGHSVTGSQFGGVIDGVDLLPNGYGVNVTYQAVGVQIGGPDVADRNVFGESLEAAINLSGSFGEYSREALVQNNLIGLTPAGNGPLPNGRGIAVYGKYNTIIDNVISSNDEVGIEIVGDQAQGNVIEANVIGRPATLCFPPNCDRGNGSHGVLIRNGANYNAITDNTIDFNGGDGVAVVASPSNSIRSNRFNTNDGEAIDLGNDGVTINDNDAIAPPASAGNNNQNFPVIGAVGGTAATGSASGTLASNNGLYRIQFYATDDCPGFLPVGEGRVLVGETEVTISNAAVGQNGTVAFANIPLAVRGNATFFATPRWILATATRSAYSNTSEFSFCRPYNLISDVIFANGFD